MHRQQHKSVHTYAECEYLSKIYYVVYAKLK